MRYRLSLANDPVIPQINHNVIPAKAGIQLEKFLLDARLREHDVT
jgi:hypothetical protein